MSPILWRSQILTKESKKVLGFSASQTDSDGTAVNIAKVSESRQGNSETGSPEDQRQKVTRSEMILVGLGVDPRS